VSTSSADPGSSAALTYVEENAERRLAELFDFLRIPSVSAKSEHRGDLLAAADWLAARMKDAGLASEVLPTDGHPVVVGEWRGAGSDAPTLLIYGHYDVQPAEPLELWSSPAFEPEVRDGIVYARGSADDKGQLYMHVKALEAHLQATGTLPLNVVIIAEGEEEVGSPNLLPFVKAHRDRLAADAVLISDSAMFDKGQPSLLFSLRGLAYAEVRLRAARGDLHSGAYGGAVPNPAAILSRMIATLHDADGRIAIEGFYDDVVEWGDEIRSEIRALPFDEERFREGVGAPALDGETGWSVLERLWIRPTCEVNGLLSGWTGEGAKTVLPAEAMAKISFRLVPDQDPDRAVDMLRDHLRSVAPEGVTVEVSPLHGGRPWKADPSGPLFDAAATALEEAFGTAPVRVGEGGSIPIVVEFEEVLECPALLVGFALPGCNMHAPDEWFGVEEFNRGTAALVRLYEELAAALG